MSRTCAARWFTIARTRWQRRSRRSRSARRTAGIRAALASYATLPHRVALVGEAGGVRWYDDSKATNPDATLRALESFDSVVLLAGGRNKGLDLGVLARAGDRVRGVVAFGEAGARGRGRVHAASSPVVTAALDARRGAGRGATSRGPATRCCSRRRARRSTRTRTTPSAATTSPPKSASCSPKEPRPMTVLSPRVRTAAALSRADRRSRKAGADDRAPAPRAAAAADLRDPVRDGRRAQHRRPGDDPLGVVGRGAERLRLVVVLLRSSAHLGGRRRRRVRRRVVVRLPLVAPCRAVAARALGDRCSSSCSCPASASWSTGRAAGSAPGAIRVQPTEVAKLALLCCGANVLARRADRLHDWRQWTPVLFMLGLLGRAGHARARPRLRDRARAHRVRAAGRRAACAGCHLVVAGQQRAWCSSPRSRSRRRTGGRGCSRSCTRGRTRRTPATRSRSR